MTYDIYFHNSENSNNKGFHMTWAEIVHYLRTADRNDSYWKDYKGGIYQIVRNETGEVIFEGNILKSIR